MAENIILKVDGRTVFNSIGAIESEHAANPTIIPTEISVRYNEPRRLLIQTLVNMGENPLQLYGSRVELWVDSVLRFSGKPFLRREAIVPGSRALTWECYDGMEEARTVRAIDPDTGWPMFLYVADWLVNAQSAGTPVFPTVKTAVERLFTNHTTTLTARGVPTSTTGYLPEITIGPLRMVNVSITDVLNRIFEYAPFCRYLIEPENSRWNFVDVLGSTNQFNVTLGSDVVPQVDAETSVRDRYTAVSLVGWGMDQGFSFDLTALTPAWDLTKNATWSTKEWLGSTGTQVTLDPRTLWSTNPYALVGRLWSFASIQGLVIEDNNLAVFIRSTDYDGTYVYYRAETQQVNTVAGLLLTKEPLIPVIIAKRYKKNVHTVGYTAPSAWLRYKRPQIIGSWLAVRVPETGYSGPATRYGIENEYRVMETEDLTTDIAQLPYETVVALLKAQAMHKSMSAIASNSTIPIAGDLPTAHWNLNHKINIRTNVGVQTGYEDLNALMTGFTHTFDRGGATTYEWSTDVSEYVRIGS